jgi:DnaK suppressor protein
MRDMQQLSADVLQKCKRKLLETKTELLNRVKDSERQLRDLGNDNKSGDEGDISNAVLNEGEVLANQERLRFQLMEIDIALSKIERGGYGVCEETEEPIEPARLLAIPWTRLSIEGAEVREAMKKRFAR